MGGENLPTESSGTGEPSDQDLPIAEQLNSTNLDDLSKEDLLNVPRTRRHLAQLRVVDLRHIARDACGSGTWISHAKKDELMYGAINGRPPRSAHKEDQGSEPPTGFEIDPAEESEEVKDGDTVHKIANRVARKTVKQLADQMQDQLDYIKGRLERVEEELGIETEEEEGFSVGETVEIMQEQIQKSDEALKRAQRRVQQGNAENRSLASPNEDGRRSSETSQDESLEQNLEGSSSIEEETYLEGESRMRETTSNKRNPKARQLCLDHYGLQCYVCGFRFEERYGKGASLVEAHHENPPSPRDGDEETDPVEDMKPLCPNCHAIAHLRRPPYTPEEIQEMIEGTNEGS